MKYVLIVLSLLLLLGMKPKESVSIQVNTAYIEIERLLLSEEVPENKKYRLRELKKSLLIIAGQLARPIEETEALPLLKILFSELEIRKKEIPVPVKEGCACTIL